MSEKNSIKQVLEEYREDLIQIPISDILVHCSRENPQLLYLSENIEENEVYSVGSKWKKLIQKNQEYTKQSELNSLCLSNYQITWKHLSYNLCTPLYLIPVKIVWLDRKQKLKLFLEWESKFINPYLCKIFPFLNTIELLPIQEIERLLIENKVEYSLNTENILGNFHHHRYILLQEIEGLIDQDPNKLLLEIFGEHKRNETINFTKEQLSSLDTSQLEVIESFETNNLVVEGPPGTGKSELLVNLLGKSLYEGRQQLVLSEKQSSLNVIYNKLKHHNLDAFAVFTSENQNMHAFIAKLSENWKVLEKAESPNLTNLLISQQHKNNLQNLLNKLTSENLIGGISFSRFIELKKEYPFSEEQKYISYVPLLSDLLVKKEELYNSFEKIKDRTLYQYVQWEFIAEEKYLRFNEILKKTTDIIPLIENCAINFTTNYKRILQFLQIIDNELVKPYHHIYNDTKKREKFKRLASKYLSTKEIASHLESEKKNWIKEPTISELEFWVNSFKNASWFQKIRIKNQINKRLSNKTIPHEIVLKNWEKYLKNNEKLRLIKENLSALQIFNPDSEIHEINLILQLWNQENISFQAAYKFSQTEREILLSKKREIEEFITFITTYLCVDNNKELNNIITRISGETEFFASNKNQILKVGKEWYKMFSKAENFHEIIKSILYHYDIELKNQFPILYEFTDDTIIDLLNQISKEEEKEHIQFAKRINSQRIQRFQKATHLIVNPNNKLSESEKTLQKKLKNGKRILIKEFGKSRHSISFRELFNSDAWEWIKIIYPCFLLTPEQVPVFFPLKKGIFDALLIDEASQMPILHALGAIQRSDKMLVVGDSKQMSPTYYFSKKSEQVDILKHSSFYFKEKTLTHHYRSRHKELIAFSNKHFYGNNLMVYPSFTQENAIQLYYCEKGIFENRKNEEEAKEVANKINKHIHEDPKAKIGVVAFSKEQLDCIWKFLTLPNQNILSTHIENGNAFFKTLENVQGEECDALYISMGYGKNIHGKFQLRMGALNRRNGYKRLNVLLTRARYRINFFTSVKSSDFPWTDNESIHLLKLYLQEIESEIINSNKNLDNCIDLKNTYSQINNAQELVTYYKVMKSRGWKFNAVKNS